MTYHRALGADPAPSASLPPDVAPTLIHEMVTPVDKRRGWVAVPTFDMRQYVQAQLLTAAAGFMVGMGMGAIFGNFMSGKSIAGPISSVARNSKRRTSRRTSTRKHKRGRPTAGAVHEVITLRMDGNVFDVSIEKGRVFLKDRAIGMVYDLGTSFRSIPYRDGDVRSFGTLAGAAKHVIREWEKVA